MRRMIVIAALLLVAALPLGLLVLSFLPDPVLARGGYEPAGTRLVTGMLVTGTPRDPVVYVTSSDPRIGAGESGKDLDLDTNSGIVSRLTRDGSGWRRVDLVRGLPRSEENHATNGVAIDPQTNTLYVAQGGNTNAGAPSHHFARLPEYALSGAVLSVDLDRIGDSTYDLPTLDDETRDGDPDPGDPFGGNDGRNQAVVDPGGPVQVHAPGFRNAYDIVFTSRGRLYTIQNGGAEEWGDIPADEGPAGRCTNEPREPGHYDPDTLHLVRRGAYYGHPNPTRGNAANTFNRGASPVPRPNPVECDYRRPAERDPVTLFRTSTNGLAEYTASSFGGALQGDLLAASFDGGIYRVRLNGPGTRALRRQRLFTLVTPLDVTAQGDAGPFAGSIWVARHNDYAGAGFDDPNLWVFEPRDRAARWATLAPSGFARQEVSFVRAGSRFYLTGGGAAQEAYDPRTDTWTKATPLPKNLDHIQGVELGGRIYYPGGLEAWPRPASATTYVYDPERGSFDTARDMPRPRGGGGVAVHDGKILYAGGLSDGRAVPWFDVYDPGSDTWSRLPDMPRARDHFHAVVAGGKLYAIGGRDTELGREISETDVYDFASRSWSSDPAPIPTPRGGFAAALLDGEIVVIGGEDANGAHSTVEAYDVRRDTWRALEPLPTGRHGIQAVVCGGAIYIAAGGTTQGGENPSSVHEVYVPRGARGCGSEADPAASPEPSFRTQPVGGTSSYNPTALQFGPDGRLYVAQQDGLIKAYRVVRRPDGSYTATATEDIDDIQRIPNHDDDGSSATDFRSMIAVLDQKLENVGL